MKIDVLLGLQWGDEGKGKIVDVLPPRYDIIARFQGGANAGHTVVIDTGSGLEHHALHLLPSGILTPGATSVIGNGVVIDLEVLFAELDGLAARGVQTGRLLISASAHIIAPYNAALDRVSERFLGARRIGTTGRGIGPTYADKVNRVGIRVQDLFDESILRQKVQGALDQKNQLLVKVYNRREVQADDVVEQLLPYADRIRPYVADTSLLLNEALDEGRQVLLEGSQGTLLDVDHGTYPFVTSSSTVAGGVCTGSGIGPKHINNVVGITKAYVTRVGSGPFPTELHDEMGERIRQAGAEARVETAHLGPCPAESRVRRRNREIADEMQDMSAPYGPSRYAGDNRLGEPANLHLQVQHVEVLHPRAVPVALAAADALVPARAERPVPRPGEDDHAHARVGMGVGEGAAELPDRLRAKGVVHLGSVDGDPGHSLRLVVEDVLVIAVRRGLPADIVAHG